MRIRRFLLGAAVAAACGAISTFVACGGSSSASAHLDRDASTEGGGLQDGSSGGGPMGDAALSPDVFGGGPGSTCLQLGAACTSSGDCCSNDCHNGLCSYPQCQSDNQPCSASSECCSQACGGGKCTPISTACSTLGNACSSNASCCSGLCASGTCQPSSFCVQPGDSCAASGDCCTGACNKASGQTLGVCAAAPPAGAANCGLVDGQLCGGSAADGGSQSFDGGLPACGGPCCSRACAPWGPTGILICQPASGCHPVGDLCTADTDCCGASGLPGGSGKPVTCDMSGGGPVGVCRLPMGCKPNGDVCKLQTMSCNASCDCCSGNSETQDTCKQDNVGVPRCTGAQCVDAGSACASSADCCNGAPCVPNPGGSPPYVCSGGPCVHACAACTNNADCCPGTSCEIPPGSAHGVCGPCGGQDGGGAPPGTDGGGANTDAGCSLYGQVCSASAQCCSGVPCTNGRCETPIQ